MARPRLELQQVLNDIAPNVYFQPPNGLKIQYPCIIYVRDNMDVSYADNGPYRHAIRYEVTVIDRNPDSEMTNKVAMLPLVSYTRFFTADDLNHDVFTLYF
ncbi:tail terminator [Gordonia phage Artorias]|nr:tail terminator [Gordonia phage Artorias]